MDKRNKDWITFMDVMYIYFKTSHWPWIMFLTSCINSGSKNENILNKLHKMDVCTHNVVKLVNCASIGIEPISALFCNSLHSRWKHTITEKLANMQLLKLQYV